MIRTLFLAVTMAAPALAQTPDPHAGHVMPAGPVAPEMDHSKMDHSKMDHGKMDMAAPAAAPAAAAMPEMDHSKMDHGSMGMTAAPKPLVRTGIGPAEAALQGFLDALEVGNRDLAIARLSPDVQIIEDGHAEDHAAYLGGHLAADMAFQKTVRTILVSRAVTAESPARVRIMSVSRMIGNRADKPSDDLVSETAVLVKSGNDWKIQRLEWQSARP